VSHDYNAKATLRAERDHLVPQLHDLHRLIGRGAVEARTEGAEVEMSDGRRLLDFGSYAVTFLGHRPPAVVDAVRRALDRMPTSTRLLANPDAAALATRLTEVTGPPLDRVWIGLNGSDAVEIALKLAIAATNRHRVLAIDGGFHGRTLGALAVTSDPDRRKPFEPLLGHARIVPATVTAVRDALAEEPVAALIVEPVQGEGGGRVIPPEILREWRAETRRHSTMLIVDEIQAGLRRCGHMSLARHHDVEPDAVLFGKALGGGVVPLSAAVCTEDLFAPLIADPLAHTATFAGHPLCCSAGTVALDLIEASGDRVAAVTPQFGQALDELCDRHAIIERVNVLGLFGAIGFVDADVAHLMALEAARRGLLVAPCITAPHVLRILPPVIVTDEQLQQAFGVLDDVAEAVSRRRPT
jgi:putrescine aminotransferase